MTELAPGSQTVTQERVEQFEDGDQDRFSHYVPKDKLVAAMVNGTPVASRPRPCSARRSSPRPHP